MTESACIMSITDSCSIFKNASAFLLRDARHAMHDILLLRISAILPEAISDGGLTPTTDTDLLLATYRGGSHLTSDIIFMLIPLCCHSSSAFTRVIFPLSRHSTNLRTSSGSNCLPASWISFSRATFTGKAFL